MLSFFNLGDLLTYFHVETFFETGTGYGDGVRHAQGFAFKQIFSVEILPHAVEELRPQFANDSRVQLLVGRSPEVMRQVLPQVRGNIIFWLDAHYPGAHHRLAAFDAEQDLSVRLPLEQELQAIKDMRPGNRDLILIDDLRIYEDDKFEMGSLKDLGLEHIAGTSGKFLYAMFAETHNARRFLNHTGYLALVPK